MNNFNESDVRIAENLGGMSYIEGGRTIDNPYDEFEEGELFQAWLHGYELEEEFWLKKQKES